jgi:hypothetical protein
LTLFQLPQYACGTGAHRLEAQKEHYDSDALGMDEEAASLTLPSKPSGTISQTMCKLIEFV